MNADYLEGVDLAFPQIAKLAERCSKYSPGYRAFYIPVLMGYKPQSLKNDNPVPVNSSNLQNDNKSVGLNSYTLGSTIKLYIPQHISSYAPSDEHGIMQVGLEFLVSFIGGDINRPVIIGGGWYA